MTPPRHVLVHIPQGSGFTQANLRELSRIAEWMKDAQSYGLNITEPRQQSNAILRRIKTNGGYTNAAALQRALMPYLVKFRRLSAALKRGNNNNNRNLGRERHAAMWRRVQNAGGRAKALQGVISMTPYRPGNRMPPRLAHIPMHEIARLVTPYALGLATPVTTTFNRYVLGPPRPRVRRALPAPPRRTPSPNRADTTTRSGRRSVIPRR